MANGKAVLVLFLLVGLGPGDGFYLKHKHERTLKVLLLSAPLYGHINPLLTVGEELSQRGHNVTLALPVEQSELSQFEEHVKTFGVHFWRVQSEGIPLMSGKNLGKALSDSFFKALLTAYAVYRAGIVRTLANNINQSLALGHWDIVIGNSNVQDLVSCLHMVHKVPFVIISLVPLLAHLYPAWPWPGIGFGAASDNFGFLDRLRYIPLHFYDQLMQYVIFGSFSGAIGEFCPEVGLRRAVSDAGTRIPLISPTVIGVEYPTTISPLNAYVGPLVSSSPTPLSAVPGLEAWLAEKPERGVVYVSMGSLFETKRETGRVILEGVMKTNLSLVWALRESNQWILEGIDLQKMYPNRVLLLNWAPQHSILQSPKIHSTILHGGMNGVSEALSCGVPMLVLPLATEQFHNAGRVYFHGLGVYRDPKTITSGEITSTLKDLDTGNYRRRLSSAQKMIHLAGGVRRAADLVEFYAQVGYDHLVPAYVKYEWNWVQYYNADVFAVLLVALATCCMVCWRCCCYLRAGMCRRNCSRNKEKTE